jgi:putative OPT family oligopeptide transporter
VVLPEKKGLPPEAYEVMDGEEYPPYVPSSQSPSEMTVSSIAVGSVLGVVFGIANAYVGLKFGMTVSASIPAAVISVAILKGLLKKGTILESNMVQTVGSAGESVAAGVAFTVPALILLGFNPGLLRIFMISLLGGWLGVLFMIPLRRFLIVREHGKLPYPEGTACAEVLVAGETGGSQARLVFGGTAVGAIYQILMKVMGLWNEIPSWRLPGLRSAQVGVDVTPELLGVGFIVGPRIAAIMLSGGALAWLVIIPVIKFIGASLAEPVFPGEILISEMEPSDVWHNYVRYIGAGAVAFGGLVSLIRAMPIIVASFKVGVREITRGFTRSVVDVKRTSKDLPMVLVLAGSVVAALVVWLAPGIPVGWLGAALVVVFTFFFVTVSSRIVGIIGSSSNPVSGMTIATLLATSVIFLFAGWSGSGGMIAALTVGAVVCIGICIASDTSQDLKTGFLVGATPSKQQMGEFIGVLTSALFIGWMVYFLHDVYEIGSQDLPAFQAVLMSMVVKGVFTSSLPWSFVLIGAGIAAVVELFRVPSLPFAVGLYLPLSLSTPIGLGGLIRLWLQKRYRSSGSDQRREAGVLYSSGLIAGAAVVSVVSAGLIKLGWDEVLFIGHQWMRALTSPLSLIPFALLALLLVRTIRKG